MSWEISYTKARRNASEKRAGEGETQWLWQEPRVAVNRISRSPSIRVCQVQREPAPLPLTYILWGNVAGGFWGFHALWTLLSLSLSLPLSPSLSRCYIHIFSPFAHSLSHILNTMETPQVLKVPFLSFLNTSYSWNTIEWIRIRRNKFCDLAT